MEIVKRNGKLVEFDGDKIFNAINKAANETEAGVDYELAREIADNIEDELQDLDFIADVEYIQNLVEDYLMQSDRRDIAKTYILYRAKRNELRGSNKYSKYQFLSDDFLSKYKHKDDPFPTELGKFVYYRTYSRPIPEENRRERWWETVARVVDFSSTLELNARKRQGQVIDNCIISGIKKEAEKIYDMMYNLKLFPSGRSLWIGNTPASYLYPLSNFNCSFITMDSLDKFLEMFFVLMLGTGVGASVEKTYIEKLPKINSNIEIIHKDYTPVPKNQRKEHTELKMKSPVALELTIGDSKFGWSKAMEMYLDVISSKQYQDIEILLINYDNVRKAGEILKTFGGRASGHIAIKAMFEKIDKIFKDKRDKNSQQWQVIKPIDALDIATIIAENVVSGGVRRSALIIFCDEDEEEVLEAKSNLYYQNSNGNWQSNDKILHRMLSNNTVLYKEKPSREDFHKHFELMKVSGEPAMANMQEMIRRRPDAQGGNPLT